ncbi:hypothetical protein EC957_002191, partial [Mortierella hygrophila]
ALTKEEFDERWKVLLNDFGRDDKARYHLCKLYDNRERWVRYSVERCFTNNTQATGGVEKVHHLIKTHLHGKRTHLLGVFHGVQQRANKETVKSNGLQAYRNKHVRRPDAYAHAMFPLVR